MDDAVHPVLGKRRQRDLTNAEVGQFLSHVAQTDKNALWTIEAVPTSGQGARPDGNAGSEVGRQQETWKASTLPQRQRRRCCQDDKADWHNLSNYNHLQAGDLGFELSSKRSA